jgi:hypothetical protein
MALRLFPHVAFASEPDSVRITLHDGAGFLLHPSASKTVSRVVVPLIVLTLTAARSGALSCITQCAFPATSADCAHQSASHPAAARADAATPSLQRRSRLAVTRPGVEPRPETPLTPSWSRGLSSAGGPSWRVPQTTLDRDG